MLNQNSWPQTLHNSRGDLRGARFLPGSCHTVHHSSPSQLLPESPAEERMFRDDGGDGCFASNIDQFLANISRFSIRSGAHSLISAVHQSADVYHYVEIQSAHKTTLMFFGAGYKISQSIPQLLYGNSQNVFVLSSLDALPVFLTERTI
ncbi:unnamed protein product [Nesidiocoris tenuis]|uniref:Uncharacterized protein n=1 Tax=Nesidiocoris tenuis TaxID=355587 RepID=A0A6H5G6G2_9HEMI|nr:unnamed protein product [Nesidiocoris tenuis]